MVSLVSTLVSNMWKIFLVASLFLTAGNANECIRRSFGENRIVCVCNATYCDGLSRSQTEAPEDGSAYLFVSNMEGLRLERSQVQFETCQGTGFFNMKLDLDPTQRYQRILGFGGAFTDSVGINMRKLSEATQNQLLRSYYDPNWGSRYAVGRIPIGGTDFSVRPYTYDDVPGDVSLRNFSLAQEDLEYKIPYVKAALRLNPRMQLFGSSWSAPAWMKTNDKINGFGFLRRQFYQTYANYLLRFLEEYKANGIDIWAITTGNEPFDTYIPFDTLNTMGWTPLSMAAWVANNLGPTLAASDYNKTLILALDDQRFNLPWYMNIVFANRKAKDYIAGTAIHWYGDSIAPPIVLDQTHNQFPDKILLMTEACNGFLPFEKKVDLGSWERGETYFLSIIEYLTNWAIGWVDWNIALDKMGGPNWINNFVDSPIIVDPDADEFFKQPTYYALKHFSRFVDTGSVRIFISENIFVKATAFITPSNETVITIYNRNIFSVNVTISDPEKGCLNVELSPSSMNTIIYRQ